MVHADWVSMATGEGERCPTTVACKSKEFMKLVSVFHPPDLRSLLHVHVLRSPYAIPKII